jgi:hypothetical protein
MGARLIGANLTDKFDVFPSPSEYVIQVQENGENFWEWWLQPKGNVALGNNTFFIQVYAPDFQDNGAVIENRQATFPVQVNVLDHQPAVSEYVQKTVLPEKPRAGFGVEYSDDQAFSLIFYRQMDVTGMTILTRRQPAVITQDFEGVELDEDQVKAGQCLYYTTQDATPVLSNDCQGDSSQVFERVLSLSDRFWYRKTNGGIQDVTIQFNGQPYICPADFAPERCDF